MTLRELLREALQGMDAAPHGHVHLQLRMRIRARFGDVVGTDEAHGPSEAVRALVALDRRTAEHVLHHWERALPGDQRPTRRFELADGPLDGTIDPRTARHERGRFAALNVPDLGDGGRATVAGAAAECVVSTAFGAALTDVDAPPGTDDWDLDVESWDCTFFASLAEGPEFDPPDIEARWVFWRWWLTQAVPQVAREAGLDPDR